MARLWPAGSKDGWAGYHHKAARMNKANSGGMVASKSEQAIRKRTPALYAKAGMHFLGQLLKRELRYYATRPIDTLFFLTYRCSSRCKTCTLWQRTNKANELPLEVWQQAVDMSVELGARNYEIFGGDALLRPDVLIPLTAYIKSKPGLTCDLPTNCNLMTENVARGLVEAGIDNVWISLDGVADDHNRVRGRDTTFDKVNKTIKWFREARGDKKRPLLHTNTTISNLNYDVFDKVLYYAEENGMDFHHLEYAGEFWDELLDQSVIDDIRPNPYFVRQDGNSILVDEDQARTIKSKIEQMKKDVRHMNISLQCENVDKLNIRQMSTGLCDNRRCYITRSKITIDPYGNVLGCPFFDNWILGNIKNQSLKEIWNNEKHKRLMTHFNRGNIKICDHCIMGVQRNPTVTQNVRDHINHALGRARL